MVGEDGDQMGGTLEILLPLCESEDDCQKFPVVNIIVLFGR